MKVLLLKDVAGQGKAGETVNVSEGYAKNYLIPRKLGQELTPALITELKNKEDARLRKIALEKAAAKELADRVASLMVVIGVQSGAGGKFYGSVTAKDIADELAKQHGIELDRRKILLPEQIKSFGSYSVDVKYYPDVVGKINVVVTNK